MRCWYCEEEPRASCAFCGRFICKDHCKTMSTFIAMFVGANNTPKGLAVANVLLCGECEPQPEPISMPELIGTIQAAGRRVRVLEMDDDWIDVGRPEQLDMARHGA